MRRLPVLEDVGSDLQIKSPQAVVDVGRDKAAALGLTAEQIRNTLYSSFGTRQVATIYTASNDYAVILEVAPSFQQTADDVTKVFLRSAGGQLVPLETVATIGQVSGPQTINHLGQLPSVTISFNLALGEAIEQILDMEKRLALPAAISTGFSGAAQVFQQSLRGQGWLLLATVVVIYLVLSILYESFIRSPFCRDCRPQASAR
jgi:HAE1 family hydrophobic/amphiphilic exporter-1